MRIWDFETRRTKLKIPHDEVVRYVTFSPDGKRLLTTTSNEHGWKYPASLQLWNAETGKLLKKFEGHRCSVSSAVFNHDASEVISCGTDGQICRWNVSTGQRLADLTRFHGWHNANLAHDGQFLVMRRFGNGVLVDLAGSLEKLSEFDVPTRSIYDLNVSVRRDRVITATSEGRVYIWSLVDE